MIRYVLNVLLALDQFVNVLLCGDPDETLSSRAAKRHPRAARFIDQLFAFDPRHCETSLEDDEGLYQVPVTERWQVVAFWALLAGLLLIS